MTETTFYENKCHIHGIQKQDSTKRLCTGQKQRTRASYQRATQPTTISIEHFEMGPVTAGLISTGVNVHSL